jgi:hypothetical protein
LKKIVFGLALLIGLCSKAQLKFSFATDVSGVRNFSPHQQFWALGQTVRPEIHITDRESFYTWISYHSPGRFKNDFTAIAKSSSTSPQSLKFTVNGLWRMREFSLGWKHYFKGSYNADKQWNVYGIAGLGLMLTRIKNTFSQVIDTSIYHLPPNPVAGSGEFRRLTVDLGIGGEMSLGGDFYVYGDLRTYLPASSYRSPYLHYYKNVPVPLMANLGVRVLFDFNY